MTNQTQTGYDEARTAILEGRAEPRALWVSIGEENARNGYALKPAPWEGPGSYQHVIIDGKSRLIREPEGSWRKQINLIEIHKRTNVTR